MEPIKKILAPTDLSQLSIAGVHYALELARTLGAAVTVYHVVNREEIMHYSDYFRHIGPRTQSFREPPDILKRYEAALARYMEENFSEMLPLVEITRKVEMGVPHKNIVERAKAEGTDLIVISTHGRTGLSHVLLGSVTEKVVRIAPCPVISIHPTQGGKTAEKTLAVG
jgi:nucleotide-binding universal stress UspA family protein